MPTPPTTPPASTPEQMPPSILTLATQADIHRLERAMDRGFDAVNKHLETQNGRVGKNERDILVLQIEAGIEKQEEAEARNDKRQETLVAGFGKLFEKYLGPSITVGGVIYMLLKSAGKLP